jgi:ProP effector
MTRRFYFQSQWCPKIDPDSPNQPSEKLMNTNSKNTPLSRAEQALIQLRERFPVFQDCKPLAIGIFETQIRPLPDVLKISKTALKNAIRQWTRQPDYLRALAEPDAWRYNLQGEPVEPVTLEHRNQAQARLAAASRLARQKSTPKPANKTLKAQEPMEPATKVVVKKRRAVESLKSTEKPKTPVKPGNRPVLSLKGKS